MRGRCIESLSIYILYKDLVVKIATIMRAHALSSLLVCGVLLALLFTVVVWGDTPSYAHSTQHTLPPFSASSSYRVVPAQMAVTTFHNDTFRSGQNLYETALNTGNVNESQFGRLATYAVDGAVYAQPLFVPNVRINGGVHNVVFVATEGDSVYAFDADGSIVNNTPLWQRSFTSPPAVTTVPSNDLYGSGANHDIGTQAGITGTPVIDPLTGTLYVVAMTKEHGQYFQRLHALDITSGNEKAGSPQIIQATIPGKGYDNTHGTISFNARRENQRPALLLSNGVIYIAWASFGDSDPYHGWIIGYSYTGSAFQQVAVYNDTPDGAQGGIWMSDAGLSADTGGNIYAITGNGSFDRNSGGPDTGDTFLRFSPQGLHVTDYFTPFNQSCLTQRDEDLGSGGPLLLPDQAGTAHPHLVLSAGKEGRFYLVDRDHMGGYTPVANLKCKSPQEARTDIDRIVQELPSGRAGPLYGIAAYYAGNVSSGQFVYIGGYRDRVRAFRVNNGLLSATSNSNTPETFAFSGATPSISSNGALPGTGIMWVVSPGSCNYPGCTPSGPGALRAYDATNLGNELYNSEQDAARDRLDSYVKFAVPTVAHGKVFVGTQHSLEIYGLRYGQFASGSVDDSVLGSGQNQFAYSGAWQHCSGCSMPQLPLYNATRSYSSVTGNSVSITFTGRRIYLYCMTGPGQGIAALTLDGGSQTLLDLYAPQDKGNQRVWIAYLPSGTHKLTLSVTGTKNVLSFNSTVSLDHVDLFP